MQTAHARRFAANADARPDAYAAFVKQKYGHTPADVSRLLDMHGKLAHGGTLSDADVKAIQRMHPEAPPAVLADMAATLNRQHGPQRADLFLGLVTMDRAAVETRFGEVGDDFKHVTDVAKRYHVEAYADAINAKRGGSADASPAWRPERGSVRDLIERQFEPPGARAAVEAIERGDPRAVAATRNLLADRLESANATLNDDTASLREHVSAAYTAEETEAVAVDEGWLPEREA